MATIHLILQGKGGVGKSMIAVMLYQALRHAEKEVIAFDTDPVNATLASFPFDVTKLDVMKDGNIEPRKFDELLEALSQAPDNAHVIVDMEHRHSSLWHPICPITTSLICLKIKGTGFSSILS